jgi:hypothetical protein
MFRVTIKDGKLLIGPVIAQRLEEWAQVHEGAHLIITEDKPERSLSELRMYRAWLSNVAAHTGNDEEELHSFLLDRCAPRIVVTIKGAKGEVEVEQVKRTSGGHKLSMNKSEMSEYMARCAQLTGYPLPTEEELSAMGYLPH